jgi:uncharacterized protein (TIGR02145 family)
MKTLILSSLLIGIVWELFGQDITISFQPKVSGTTIDSIWVTNQRTNQKVKLQGNESLVLTKTTGIDFINDNQAALILYPNPCYGDGTAIFSISRSQEVELRIYNASGQLLNQKRQKLFAGQHSFILKFPVIGMYTIAVLKDEGSLSIKAVCMGLKKQEGNILYVGIEQVKSNSSKQLKNAEAAKTLIYTQGDILSYSLFSNKNNTIMTDSPTATKSYNIEFYECIDPDKKSYKVVKIGNQVWMAENLAYLPSVSPSSEGSEPVMHFYVYEYEGNNKAEAKSKETYLTYGVLYNFLAAMNGKFSSCENERGICPEGWHIPSNEEWTTLENYLISNGYNFDESKIENKIAKSISSKTQWYKDYIWESGCPNDNPSTNNRSNFSGYPGGVRGNTGFFAESQWGIWWTSTNCYSFRTTVRGVTWDNTGLWEADFSREDGVSVRCLRD